VAQAIAPSSLALVLLPHTAHSRGVIEAMIWAGCPGLYVNLAAQANPVLVKHIDECKANPRCTTGWWRPLSR
jgi:hypothetical protein